MPIEYILGIVLVFLFILAFYKEISKSKKQIKKDIKSQDAFGIGTYVSGLSGGSLQSATECNVTEKNFVFITNLGGDIGHIPRDMINGVFVEDHSHIESRITATRMLAMGIFSLAAKKKTTSKEYFLLIDWQNDKGMQENTLFKHEGITANVLANAAAEKMKKYILPKREFIKDSEKKCPFCAEIIKIEAKICKHCKSKLDDNPIA